MNLKTYLVISGLFYTMIALLHLTRFIMKIPIMVGGWSMPVWMSFGGFVIPLALGMLAFRHLESARLQ